MGTGASGSGRAPVIQFWPGAAQASWPRVRGVEVDVAGTVLDGLAAHDGVELVDLALQVVGVIGPRWLDAGTASSAEALRVADEVDRRARGAAVDLLDHRAVGGGESLDLFADHIAAAGRAGDRSGSRERQAATTASGRRAVLRCMGEFPFEESGPSDRPRRDRRPGKFVGQRVHQAVAPIRTVVKRRRWIRQPVRARISSSS